MTHLGAFGVFVYLLLTQLWPEAPWLYYTSVASLVVCMLNSVLYHTFMNMTAHYDTWLLVLCRHRLLSLLGALLGNRGESRSVPGVPRRKESRERQETASKSDENGSLLTHNADDYTRMQLDVLGIFGCFFVCEVAIVWFGFACFPHLRSPSLLLYYPVAFFAIYKARRPQSTPPSPSLPWSGFQSRRGDRYPILELAHGLVPIVKTHTAC